MKKEGDGGQPPSFCHTHHFIVFGPAVVPSQDPSNEEELQKQTLDLLVNFAYRLQMDGLMPDLPEQPPGEPSSGSGFLREVGGSKAKHPGAPLLEASMAMAPGPSPGICASSPASATTVLPVQPDVGLLAPATPEVPLGGFSSMACIPKELPGPVPEAMGEVDLYSWPGVEASLLHQTKRLSSFDWVFVYSRCIW